MKKLLTFLTLLTLFFTTSWAETTTLDITDASTYTVMASGTSGSGSETTIISGDITVTSNKGFLDGTNHFRVYSGGNLTISTALGNITKVEITCTASGTSNNGPSKLTHDAVGSYTYSGYVGTWTGSSATVPLRATAQCRFTKVVVTYEGGSTEPDPTTPSGTITFNPAAGEVTSGTEVAISFSGTCTGIKYTTDGTSPSATNGTVYDASNPPAITGATTITAAAYNFSNSKYAFGTEASASYTIDETPIGNTETATFVFTNGGNSVEPNTGDLLTTKVQKGVTLTWDGTTSKWYTGSGGSARMYNGSTLSISAGSNNIRTIEFSYALNSFSQSNFDTGAYNSSTNTLTCNASTVNISTTSQVNIKTITVTYESSSSGPEYYLVGTFNNWTKNEDYKFFENNGTFTLDNVSLPANSQFKIIKVDNGTTWYGGTGEVVYNIHHRHHTNLPMNGGQNYTVQSAGTTSFSFTVSDNTPSNLNVNRTASLAIKGDFTDNWTEVPMTATGDGWTTTQTVAVNNEFGFVDEFGQYIDILWTVGTEHLGINIPMTTEEGAYTVGNYKMGIAGTFNFTANSDLTALVITDASQGGDGDVYTLVESAADLVEGGEYIIASGSANDPYTVLMGAVSNNIGGAVTSGFTYDASAKAMTLNEGCTAQVLTLGGSTDAWTFYTGSAYLSLTSDGNNLYTSASANDNNAKWTINNMPLSKNLIANNEYTARYLEYNSGSPRFACYKGTQQAVALFKKSAASNKSAAPVITPEGGNVVGYSQEVEITQANGGTIYYTTDGTTPTEDPTHQYNGKFWAEGENLGDEVTITAVAKEEGKELSNPVSVTYKFIAPAAPTFSPQGGTYTSYQYVELASATEGADVYYTTDGSNPSVNNGTKYTEPIAVTENVTIKAITVYHDAHVNKDATSGSRQAKYTIVTDGIVEVENIAEFNAIQPDENDEYPEVRFKNPVTVLYDYSQRSYSSQLQETTYQEYIWVKDQSGFTQIFLRPSLNSNNTTTKQIAFYENGDVIPGGFVVRKQYYETGEYYQAYSDKAGTDPTLPGSNVAAGFAGATQKALADPEPMTAAQLATLTTSDENIANYNNRYIRISKIKVTYIDGKNFDFEDENGKGSNIAGYNKYSDATSYMKGGETLVTETINFPQTASNTTYYDVTAILCTWQNGWEIMPIKFEPYVEKTVTLRELCDKGVTTPGQNEYTISNNLMGVYASKDGTKLWVKDDDGQAIVKYAPNDEYPDNFAIEAEGNTRLDQQYYDQSNWCEIQLAEGEDNANDFVGKIIKGGSIQGTFTIKTNPTMTGVTLTNDDIYSDGSYEPNYYIPCNFFGNQSCNTDMHGQPGHGDYFFMTPKPQEYAMVVWAIWDSKNEQFVVNENPQYNSHGFQGSFKVDLSLNQNPNIALHDGMDDNFAYNFSAIIRVNNSKAGSDFMVYPLDLSAATDPATAIESVVAGNGEVKSVKYVNVAGMVSDVPFQGINIVVTEYTDGTRTTTKMLKK